MSRASWSAVVLVVVPLVVSCAASPDGGVTRAATSTPSVASATPVPAPVSTPSAPPTTAPESRRGLAHAAVDAAQAAVSTEPAVAVPDRTTGELAVNGRGAEPYYAAPLSKLVVIVDVLDRRRLEGPAVTDAALALFRRALGPSGDIAMSALWERFDGVGRPSG